MNPLLSTFSLFVDCRLVGCITFLLSSAVGITVVLVLSKLVFTVPGYEECGFSLVSVLGVSSLAAIYLRIGSHALSLHMRGRPDSFKSFLVL